MRIFTMRDEAPRADYARRSARVPTMRTKRRVASAMRVR